MEEGVWDSEEEEYMFYGVDFEEWRSSLPKIRPYEVLSGEVARYRLEFTLNQTGKAFLLLDDYLKSGIIKEGPISSVDRSTSYSDDDWDDQNQDDY